jgi:hypothetical protein
MKVFVQAIGLLVGCAGSACAMALTPVARDPHLIFFYTSLTGGMTVTTIVFWLVFRGGDRLHLVPQLKNNVSIYGAVPGTPGQVFCHPAYRVPETAPVLLPINAGGPIVLPSRKSSHSSRLFHTPSQDTTRSPTLPRRSSRRLRWTDIDLATCNKHREAYMTMMNQEKERQYSQADQLQQSIERPGDVSQVVPSRPLPVI